MKEVVTTINSVIIYTVMIVGMTTTQKIVGNRLEGKSGASSRGNSSSNSVL